LVDDVTYEAEETGHRAARYVLNGEYGNNITAPAHKHKEPDSGIICIACPKACPLIKTEKGYAGAACGRKDPVPFKKL
jgi:succinate dehydrogenase/fumarate reductase-like Fe-S protein